VTAVLVGFARTLRHAGVDATPDRVPALLAAADALGAGTVEGVYWAGRLTLCGCRDDHGYVRRRVRGYFRRRDARPAARHPAGLTLPRPSAPFVGPDTQEQRDGPDAYSRWTPARPRCCANGTWRR